MDIDEDTLRRIVREEIQHALQDIQTTAEAPMNTKEMARHLGISPEALTRRANAGHIGSKLLGQWLF